LNINTYIVGGDTNVIDVGASVKLGVTVYNGTGNYTYHWVQSPGSKLIASSTASPTWYAFSSPHTEYHVTCTVTDLGLPAGHNIVQQSLIVETTGI
jgi:hypothetical protein